MFEHRARNNDHLNYIEGAPKIDTSHLILSKKINKMHSILFDLTDYAQTGFR